MRPRSKPLLCCCFLLPILVAAQNVTIDSIKHRLEIYEPQDSSVVESLNDLAFEYFSIEPAKTLEYSQRARTLALELDYTFGIANGYMTEGIYYWTIGDTYAAIEAFLRSVSYYEELDNIRGLVGVHVNLGLVYRRQGLPLEALSSHLKALELAEEIEYSDGVRTASLNAGVTYFADLEDYGNGLKYLTKAQNILRLKKGRSYGDNFNNIGEVYFHLNKPKLAKAYFDSAWVVLNELNDQRGIATYYRNMALLDMQNGAFDNALINLKRTEKITSSIALSSLLLESYSHLADVLYNMNDFKKSADYRQRYIELSDSLSSDEKDRELTLLKTKFETDQKEKEIGNQKLEIAERDLALVQSDHEFQNLLYLLYSLFLFIVVGGFIAYIIVRNKNVKRSRQLVEAQINVLKNQLSPHFLFNSLSVVSSAVGKNPELANESIHELANTYRMILQTFNEEVVEIGVEIDLVKSYLKILKYRYGDSFKVEMDITLDNILVPPLSVQLVVENAFKHNAFSVQKPLKIRIFNEEDYLVVSNNCQPVSDVPFSTKIGLEALEKRYAMLADKRLVVSSNAAEYIIRMPIFRTTT